MINTSQNGGRKSKLLNFIEEVNNCPAVRDVSSVAYKDTKKRKENGASKQTG